MKDILERLAESSATESSHELQCRCFDAAEEISRLRNRLPKEPSPGLLVSMAIRHDHALGMPGYYDQALIAQPGLTHKQIFDSVISQMRQLYEEVSGHGFYSPEKEREYADLINANVEIGKTQ